jgi:serine/threonine protein phosphatase 1
MRRADGQPVIWRRKQTAKIDRLAPGLRIYAIADIHGRLDLLHDVMSRIAVDATSNRPSGELLLVFLGDYVDRGPSSAQVLDYLIKVKGEWSTVILKGNHEAMLLDFLEDPLVLKNWGAWGGFNTLLSYDVAPPLQPSDEDCRRLSAELKAALPRSHFDFLAGLPLTLSRDDYFFVHAGIRPGVPLEGQTEADLLWIRDEFLLYERRFEKCVVHGHTPVREPEFRSNRINLDTGAYATGRLSCLVLEEDRRRLL